MGSDKACPDKLRHAGGAVARPVSGSAARDKRGSCHNFCRVSGLNTTCFLIKQVNKTERRLQRVFEIKNRTFSGPCRNTFYSAGLNYF
jgi:hypothetical protein